MLRRLAPVLAIVLLGGILVGGFAFQVARSPGPVRSAVSSPTLPTPVTDIRVPTTAEPQTTTTVSTLPQRAVGSVPGWTVGQPWGSTVGLTMFRGNPTRTYYGSGPIPTSAPTELWSYPETPMCGLSTVAGETTQWCGTGWTGQPVVWERPDGVTEVIFGAYDKAVHFLDAASGTETRPPFPVGDIIKGSVTLDPDGFPLLYFGSRDNRLRIVGLDRPTPTELWGLDASAVEGIWNDDWDSNPVVVDDVMFEGGENGWFFAIALNRRIGAGGLVEVSPEIVYQTPGWTDQLLADVGSNVSIESSVARFEDRAYFTNSGGRVVGIDVSKVGRGVAEVVFDYWAGDDIDATPVIDAEGMLYLAIEEERRNARSAEVGQLVKLDPYSTGDPRQWGVEVPGIDGDGGIWATPALGHGHIYVPTHTGRLLAVDTATGEVVWEDQVGPHAWSSAVVVEDRLIVATCETIELRSYSLANPAAPALEWSLGPAAGGCIESTPAVWRGRIYVGSRDGFFRAYG